MGLNPHVVGRFFREVTKVLTNLLVVVLIPMWWGGFSENTKANKVNRFMEVLIPMWWGGFSESKYWCICIER